MQEKQDQYKSNFILLSLASFMLLLVSVYLVHDFSFNYGVGVGSILQASHTNSSITPDLQSAALNLSSVYVAMWESYLLVAMSAIMTILALELYFHRTNKYEAVTRRYTLVHTLLSIIYIILFFIISASGLSYAYSAILLFAAYFGMIVALITDAYTEYVINQPKSAKSRSTSGFLINPATPYSNLLLLKEKLFSGLQGNLMIVDKHFNSQAIDNLHRLLDGATGKIESITLLTSKDMLDSKFPSNYGDLRNELNGKGVKFEVKLMDEKDASDQHERFMISNKGAFKIPPINIINKKSEHITRINDSSARRRFNYLYKRAITLENHMLKLSREPDQ